MWAFNANSWIPRMKTEMMDIDHSDLGDGAQDSPYTNLTQMVPWPGRSLPVNQLTNQPVKQHTKQPSNQLTN